MRRLLRPLVRFLVAHGIGLPYFTRLLKEIYVEVALNEFPVAGRRPTNSRISLITGVHRKDVRALRARAEAGASIEAPRSLSAQLIARWTGDPLYLDANGRPLPLVRHGRGEGPPSFDDLVVSVSRDIRSRAVLDEWLRLGIATLDAQDRVVLLETAFIPRAGSDEKAEFFGRNLHDHVAASVSNMLADDAPFPERSVYYGGLTPSAVEELKTMARELGMSALQAVNRRAIELQKRDEGARDATRRMNFGIYFFSEETSRDDGSRGQE